MIKLQWLGIVLFDHKKNVTRSGVSATVMSLPRCTLYLNCELE